MSDTCETCRHWRRQGAGFVRMPDDKLLGTPAGAPSDQTGLCKSSRNTYHRMRAGASQAALPFTHETYSCESYKARG